MKSDETNAPKDWANWMRGVLDDLRAKDPQKVDWEKLLDHMKASYGDRPALLQGDGPVSLSFTEIVDQARALATFLESEWKLKPGSRLICLSESQPYLGVMLFACALLEVTFTPLDIKLELGELESLMLRSGAKCALVSDDLLDDRSPGLADTLKACKIRFLTFSQVNKQLQKKAPAKIERFLPRDITHPLFLIYTSGTTDQPKGVLLSALNVLTVIQSINKVILPTFQDRYLSILPANHAFELTCGLLRPMISGSTVVYAETPFPQEVARIFREKKILTMLTVPLFLRGLKRYLEIALNMDPKSREWWAEAKKLDLRSLPIDERRKQFGPALGLLGGEFENFTCGGAPLEPELAGFFENMGIAVLQGYGLTETGPTSCVNTFQDNRHGTVGRPLPGVEIKIVDDEVRIRGGHVMLGYDADPESTAKAIDPEGWFRTGDRGHFDEDGFLQIEGRINDVIVLSNGKKVSPDEIELAMGIPLGVEEYSIVGLTTGSEGGGLRSGMVEVAVVAHLSGPLAQAEKSIREATLGVASFKRPTRLIDFGGELPKTTTRKVKRRELLKEISKWQKAGILEQRSAVL